MTRAEAAAELCRHLAADAAEEGRDPEGHRAGGACDVCTAGLLDAIDALESGAA